MQQYFQKLQDLFVFQDLFLIFLSILVGLVIGAEREYRNKSAGLRTLMLVCLGACLFTILSLKIGVKNPDRIAANIITGIGFLGAGVIFKDDNKVNGVTTACSIWVTAALGMSIGSGHIFLALLASVFTLIVLRSLVFLEKWIEIKNRIHIYKLTAPYSSDLLHYLEKIFADHHLSSSIVSQFKNEQRYTINFRLEGRMKNHKSVTNSLLTDTRIEQLEV